MENRMAGFGPLAPYASEGADTLVGGAGRDTRLGLASDTPASVAAAPALGAGADVILSGRTIVPYDCGNGSDIIAGGIDVDVVFDNGAPQSPPHNVAAGMVSPAAPSTAGQADIRSAVGAGEDVLVGPGSGAMLLEDAYHPWRDADGGIDLIGMEPLRDDGDGGGSTGTDRLDLSGLSLGAGEWTSVSS